VSADQHVFYKINLPDPVEDTRKYPEGVEKYTEAKKEAAENANQDKDKYMAIKTPVIQEILERRWNSRF